MRHVAIDTNALFTTQAGVARYIRGLLRGLSRVAPPSVSFLQVAWGVENFAYAQPQRALKTLYRELIWMKAIAPSQLTKQDVELLHSPIGVWITPPPHLKHVVTIHDLAVFHRPERFRPWHRSAGRRSILKAALADRVICISQFTADQVLQLLGLPAKKIEVVYNGCEFHSSEPSLREESPPGPLPSEFFLFVGSLEPGKNLALLRDVYEIAARKGDSLPPLVIVGARWEGTAHEGQPPADWHYLGRQSDEALVFLYRRALALVFPSKYEGFGLPLVEAMTLGCPVICSPVASLPEVGGTGVLFCDLKPEAYLESMRSISSRPDLRAQLIQAGREEAKRFTWDKCAQETLSVYQDVCP